MEKEIEKALDILRSSKHTTAFTGAGISVESGIPPFRGENGLWNKYDPMLFDINHFFEAPEESWQAIKQVFYDFFGTARPNPAHVALAAMEKEGYLHAVITQNIDNLHREAGNKVVYEYHGNSHNLICTKCKNSLEYSPVFLDVLPVRCPDCNGLIKPDFIFFGEGIPEYAARKSEIEASLAEVFIVIGTTGEIMPACLIPHQAKSNGALIIEINVEPSNYTHGLTDIFIQGKAGEVLESISNRLIHN